MSEQEQTVVEQTDSDATPSAEETSAQEKEQSVDELLAEFDGESDDVKTSDQESKTKDVELNEKQRKQILEDLQSQMAIEQELKETVADIKGDLDIEDTYIRWKLEEMASKDERVWKAFIARNKKPAAWNKIVKDIKSEIAGKYGKSAGTDKEKIASQVRSATGSTSSSNTSVNDIKKMSDADFENNKEKLLAQAMKG